MEILFRDYILSHILRPCIETYFNGKKEFIGEIYGFKEGKNFILEDVFMDITPKRKQDGVDVVSSEVLEKIVENLKDLMLGHHIGDVHCHIKDIWRKDVKKARNKKEYIESLEKMTIPSDDDYKTMIKDSKHIYLIIALHDKKYKFRRVYSANKRSLIGSTKDITYLISAWYYNKRLKKFDNAKITARTILNSQ